MKTLIRMMCEYNSWANARLMADCLGVGSDAYSAEHRTETGCLYDTLAHALLIDQVWLARLAGETAPSLFVDATTAITMNELAKQRVLADDRLLSFANWATEGQLARALKYRAGLAIGEIEQPVALALMYLFQQQTHWRAQAQMLLFQMGVEGNDLDFILFQQGYRSPAPAATRPYLAHVSPAKTKSRALR